MAWTNRREGWAFQPQRLQYPNQELFGRGALVWSGAVTSAVVQAGAVRIAAQPQFKGTAFGPLGISGAWNAASGDGLRFPNWRPDITTAVTCFVVAAPVSGSGNVETAFALSPDASVYGKFPSIALQFNASYYGSSGYPGNVQLSLNSTSAERAAWADSGGVDGGLHCWASGADSSSSYILRDGVDITYLGDSIAGTMTRPEQQFFIGAHPAYDGTRTMTSPLYLVAIVPRKMSETEAALISAKLLRNLGAAFAKRSNRVFRVASATTVPARYYFDMLAGRGNLWG